MSAASTTKDSLIKISKFVCHVIKIFLPVTPRGAGIVGQALTSETKASRSSKTETNVQIISMLTAVKENAVHQKS